MRCVQEEPYNIWAEESPGRWNCVQKIKLRVQPKIPVLLPHPAVKRWFLHYTKFGVFAVYGVHLLET